MTRTHAVPLSVHNAEYERNGYRPLVGDEADKLAYMQPVTVLDTQTGELSQGKVIAGRRGEVVKVLFRSGAIFTFDIDNPSYWPASEKRDRKAPWCVEDGREWVIVTHNPYPSVVESSSLFDALKASKEIAQLRKEVAETARKYDTLWADHLALQERVHAVESITKPRAVA